MSRGGPRLFLAFKARPHWGQQTPDISGGKQETLDFLHCVAWAVRYNFQCALLVDRA